MPGPVFIHFQTYARKANEAGNSVAQVIAEALRRPAFCGHVEDPKPPRVVHGTPETFEADHTAHIENRRTEVKRKGKSYRKAIRQDRHTLATAVASYPLTYDQIAEGGPDAAALHRDWEARTVAWMRDRYGDQLRVVLAHEDEPHPHLHFWLLPDNGDARADALHPGKVAKHQAEAEARDAGLSDREAVRVGNIALKAAMRSVLDDYWREVGQPVGMTRDGPKRQRLTRAEWQARKAQAARHGETLRRAEVVGAVVDEAEAKASAVIEKADARDAETKAKRGRFNDDARDWLAKNRKALAERQTELDSMEKGLGVQVAAFNAKQEKAKQDRNKAAEFIRTEREKVEQERAEVQTIKAEAVADRKEAGGLMKRLNSLLDEAAVFLRLPGLPESVRKAGAALFTKAGRDVPEPETASQAEGGSRMRRLAGLDQAPASAPPPQPRQEPSPAPVRDRSDDFSL